LHGRCWLRCLLGRALRKLRAPVEADATEGQSNKRMGSLRLGRGRRMRVRNLAVRKSRLEVLGSLGYQADCQLRGDDMTMGVGNIVALVCVIISIVLALFTHEATNALLWVLLAIFAVLWWGAKSPWGT
jgi:hypothetical protein